MKGHCHKSCDTVYLVPGFVGAFFPGVCTDGFYGAHHDAAAAGVWIVQLASFVYDIKYSCSDFAVIVAAACADLLETVPFDVYSVNRYTYFIRCDFSAVVQFPCCDRYSILRLYNAVYPKIVH